MEEKAGAQGAKVGQPDSHVLTARRLRQLAEKASGLRDQRLALVYLDAVGGASAGWDLVDSTDPRARTEPHIMVNEPVVRDRAGVAPWGSVKSVQVSYPGGDHDLVKLQCDALFWSPAAIEKFVIGYYLPLQEPDDWMPLYLRLNGKLKVEKTLYAIAHTYPSVGMMIEGDTHFLTTAGVEPEKQFLAETRALALEQFVGLF